MLRAVRWFLSVEAAAFGAAALVHAGLLARGYEHAKAATAEGVIAAVLLAGLGTAAAAPERSRAAGLVCQAFALLGTLVGVAMMAIGVGPRSGFDLVLHAGFVALLAAGLVRVARGGVPAGRCRAGGAGDVERRAPRST